ncbi:hypothetical protein LRS03_06225 [Rhizobacter sp. J219]|nr:hypothetical protein [Rhizobacter sp. J219]MCR5882481.1 hypothetical protein [Rhizobacter sp. J219]
MAEVGAFARVDGAAVDSDRVGAADVADGKAAVAEPHLGLQAGDVALGIGQAQGVGVGAADRAPAFVEMAGDGLRQGFAFQGVRADHEMHESQGTGRRLSGVAAPQLCLSGLAPSPAMNESHAAPMHGDGGQPPR